MSRKLTYQEVKSYIESFIGYILLSKEYKNSQTKLEIQCPEGHVFWMTYANFKQGQRCPYCNIESRKLTHNQVKNYIESFIGYILLSKEYQNLRTKLKIRCPEGHVFWMTFNNFRQGKRCPDCFGTKKHTYQEIKSYIESFKGYILLSTEYKNIHTKLKIRCPEGHVFWMSYVGFKRGRRCPDCFETKKLTYNQVKNYIESFIGHILLSKEYKNSQTKLEIQCPEGHIFWMTYANFQRGKRCPDCSGKKKLTYEEVKSYIESFIGHILLSKKYKNNQTKLKIRCPEGHVFWMSYTKFRQGRRCYYCHIKSITIPNQEIIDKLSFCEDIRETEDKQIEVRCTYCGEWHIPERGQLLRRVGYIDGRYEWENRLYCSQQCKDECPIYGQVLYPKDQKHGTSREVQPELRQMVLKRDNYTCQKCNKHKDDLEVGLHCHHIWPVNEDPILSADMDTCITYCKDCHKWVHMNTPGCGYGEMKCSLEDEMLV